MVTRRPGWAFSLETARQASGQAFRHGQPGRLRLHRRRRPTTRRSAPPGRSSIISTETQKSSLEHIDRLLPYRSARHAGDRRVEPPQPGDHPHDPRRPPRRLAAWRARPHRHGDGLAAAGRVAGQSADRRAGDPRAARGGRRTGGRRGPGRSTCARRCGRSTTCERLLARVTTGRASPRDLSFLGRTLRALPALKAKLTAPQERAAEPAGGGDRSLPRPARHGSTRRWPTTARCRAATAASSATAFTSRWTPCASWPTAASSGSPAIRPRRASGRASPTLKVGFNKVFGYYIEITNTHREKIPAEYIRKQTVKNAERYITPELKEYEEKVLTADEKAKELEYELFLELRDAVAADRRRMQATADGAGPARRAGRRWPSWPGSGTTAGRRSSRSRCCGSSTGGIRCWTCSSRTGRSCPTT